MVIIFLIGYFWFSQGFWDFYHSRLAIPLYSLVLFFVIDYVLCSSFKNIQFKKFGYFKITICQECQVSVKSNLLIFKKNGVYTYVATGSLFYSFT